MGFYAIKSNVLALTATVPPMEEENMGLIKKEEPEEIVMPSTHLDWSKSDKVLIAIRKQLLLFGTLVLEKWPILSFPAAIKFIDGSGLIHIIASISSIDAASCFRWCAEKGLNFGERNGAGLTPALVAAASGNMAALKCLVAKHKRTPETEISSSQGDTPLHLAASAGHENIVTWLLGAREMYKSVTVPNLAGRTAFMEAARKGHETICNALLQSAGYSRESRLLTQVDGRKQSVFHHVSEEGHPKILGKLLVLVTRHNIRLSMDHLGNSPLAKAVERNQLEVTKIWTAYYRELSLNFSGGKKKNVAFQSPIDGPLLDCNHSGNNIVMLAAACGSLKILKHLVEDCGIDLTAHSNTKTGNTVLHAAYHHAEESRSLDTANWILDHLSHTLSLVELQEFKNRKNTQGQIAAPPALAESSSAPISYFVDS